MIKKHILITGASGTVGIEVLKQLLDKKNYDITVFDKRSKATLSILKPYQHQITLMFGDISKPHDLEAIANVDVAIHLAALIPPAADDLPELAEKINTGGTKNLIQQLESKSPSAFFMYSSSISVYGDRIQNPYISIDDPLLPSKGDAYAVTKITAEALLKDSKLDWTIFRLAAIMGNHKISKLMFHQPLDTALEIATPSDTARAFVNGIEKQKALTKRTFNLGGGENCRITYRQFLERSFVIFGLGELQFPYRAFADKNFHCGYYADGHDLEHIVNFRQQSIEDYFASEANKVPALKKRLTSIFKRPIKGFLLNKSEPYQAFKTQDAEQMQHYFNLKHKP